MNPIHLTVEAKVEGHWVSFVDQGIVVPGEVEKTIKFKLFGFISIKIPIRVHIRPEQ